MNEREAHERLGELAREARKLLGLTQAQLGENASVSIRTVQKLEAGDPIPAAMSKIERALGWAPGKMNSILIVETGDTPSRALRRVRQGAAEMVTTIVQRRLGPKGPRDKSLGEICAACGLPFAIGDYTLLSPLGPGGDHDMQKLAREGLAYQTTTVEIHWRCATGEDGEDDDDEEER